MIKFEKDGACNLFVENIRDKRNNEFFNEYGYKLSPQRDNKMHFESFQKTNQNNRKIKPKR